MIKTGILVSNLGTPSEPTESAVREYLAEFLSDSYIVDYPQWLWQPVLHGLILKKRPRLSAAGYQKIWVDDGSPLRVYSAEIASKLQALYPDTTPVALGMRYGTPSLGDGLDKLIAAGVNHIILLPLYPQFSFTTTASTIAATKQVLAKSQADIKLEVVPDYHAHPAYIEALARSIESHWQTSPRGETLLFSFHGTPERTRQRGDIYFDQCRITAHLLAAKLGLKPDDWQMTFQSKFGPGAWLLPATNKTLMKLAHNETRNVDVVCPGFSTDCLETLEEIKVENREIFLSSGGKQLSYIPCLNDSDTHINALHQIVADKLDTIED